MGGLLVLPRVRRAMAFAAVAATVAALIAAFWSGGQSMAVVRLQELPRSPAATTPEPPGAPAEPNSASALGVTSVAVSSNSSSSASKAGRRSHVTGSANGANGANRASGANGSAGSAGGGSTGAGSTGSGSTGGGSTGGGSQPTGQPDPPVTRPAPPVTTQAPPTTPKPLVTVAPADRISSVWCAYEGLPCRVSGSSVTIIYGTDRATVAVPNRGSVTCSARGLGVSRPAGGGIASCWYSTPVACAVEGQVCRLPGGPVMVAFYDGPNGRGWRTGVSGWFVCTPYDFGVTGWGGRCYVTAGGR